MKIKKHLIEDIHEAKESIKEDKKLLAKMKKNASKTVKKSCQCKKGRHG